MVIRLKRNNDKLSQILLGLYLDNYAGYLMKAYNFIALGAWKFGLWREL